MQKQRVLVVEDDPAIRRGIVDSLRFEGYDTVDVGNGDEGLDRALNGAFDLLHCTSQISSSDGFVSDLTKLDLLDGSHRAHPLHTLEEDHDGLLIAIPALIHKCRFQVIVADGEELRPWFVCYLAQTLCFSREPVVKQPIRSVGVDELLGTVERDRYLSNAQFGLS